MQVIDRSVNAIHLHDCHSYPKDSEVTNLTTNIRRHGLLVPISVDSNYFVIDGIKRLYILKQLGYEDISCIMRVCDGVEFFRLRISFNQHRENKSDLMRVAGCSRNTKLSDYSFALGVSNEYVIKQLNLKSVVKYGNLPVATLYALAKLERVAVGGGQDFIDRAKVELAEVIVPKIMAKISEVRSARRLVHKDFIADLQRD